MSKEIKIIRDIKVEFDEKRILRLIGYKKREIEGSVKEIILGEKERLSSLISPLSIYTVIDYEETNKHQIFDHARKVAICVCTIGKKLEDESARLMKKNEILRALVLDALGSEAVEEVAVHSDNIISKEALKMNLWPSKRFSPGYGKWDIREQKFVFKVVPAEGIGVKLNESMMMVPRKSISFRINFYAEKKYTTKKIEAIE